MSKREDSTGGMFGRRAPWWGPRRGGAFDTEPVRDYSGAITYGGPWAAMVGGGLAVEVTHLLVQSSPAAMSLTVLGMSGAGYGIASLMRRLDVRAKADRDTQAVHMTNCTAMSVGAVGGTLTGLDSALTAGTWVIAGTALAIANNIWSKFGSKLKNKEDKKSRWAGLEEKIGLAQQEVKDIKTNGRGTVFVETKAADGATAEDIKRAIPAMASALGVGAGRITHTVDPDNSSLGRLRIQVADMLKEGIPWRGPSAFGASIGAVPLRLGIYEDGEDLLANICGSGTQDPGPVPSSNVEHGIAMGVNGAGKTQGNGLIITEVGTRTEATTVVIDCSKFDQDFGHLRHGIDLPIKDKSTARRFFKTLPKAIEARTDELARLGLSYWKPGCGLNFIVIVAEEAADFAEGNEHFQKILRTARAAGIWILTSIQRATHNNMDTDSRANSPAGMCYGLRDGADAQFCLPDEAIDAGAWPQWGNRKPGYLYLAGLGAPEERWAVTARTEYADKRALADAITAGRTVRTPLDAITAGALGEIWSQRQSWDTPLLPADEGAQQQVDIAPLETPRPVVPDTPAALTDPTGPAVEQAPTHTQPTPPPAPAAPVAPAVPGRAVMEGWPPEETIDDMDNDRMAEEVADLTDMFEMVLAEDPEPGAYDHITEIEEPDQDAPVIDLGNPFAPEETLTSDQARDAIYARLDEWLHSGKTSFAPRELTDITMRLDRGPAAAKSWFYRLRDRLIKAEIISPDESEEGFGRYDILRSPLADNNGE